MLRRGIIAFLFTLIFSVSAFAGEITREKLAGMFPAPFVVGEKDASFPVWPIFNGGATSIAGWAFETTDLAPVPGFSGTPPNLLIVLAPDGTFTDVRVLSHHEPIFLEGLGEEPLHKYVEQYRGLSLGKPIKVGSNINSAEKTSSGTVYVNGVLKATASVLIINQTVLASSIKVAKAKLGLGGASASANPAVANRALYEKLNWQQMLDKGLVQHISFKNAEVEKLFAGTIGEGLDPVSSAKPDEAMIDFYVADATLPSVGRNLWGDEQYARLLSYVPDQQPMLLVINAGRWNVMGDDWTPGSVPDRLIFKQAKFPIVVRDMAWTKPLLPEGVPSQTYMLVKIPTTAGFDGAAGFELEPHVTRAKGQIFPERVAIDLSGKVKFPDAYYILEKSDTGGDGWQSIWKQRWLDISVIAISLVILMGLMFWQKRLAKTHAVFTLFRLGFLVFTLVFIGWHAQAQLSVVTLGGIVKAALQTHDFTFLLWDPPSLLLWAFTLLTFVLWGRGVFCGWLCPFGALQELAAEISRRLHIPQWRVPEKLDYYGRYLKYVTLAMIVFAATRSGASAETLAEVEPFKTSITLVFVRHWPYVTYAVVLIVANLFVYKAFCRYLCPLGAFMALGDLLRIQKWISRRVECGSPCQLCKVKCRYGAIEKTGAINYKECFACLDCVAIINDPKTCVPDVLAAKARKAQIFARQPV